MNAKELKAGLEGGALQKHADLYRDISAETLRYIKAFPLKARPNMTQHKTAIDLKIFINYNPFFDFYPRDLSGLSYSIIL